MRTTRRSSLHKQRDEGFTLIEVLVAVAILGIALTAFSVGTTNSLRAYEASRDETTAVLLIQERITELRLAAALPSSGSLNQEQFQGDFANYISETAVVDTPFPVIKEIHVNISKGDSNDKIDEFLTYMTSIPAVVDPLIAAHSGTP